jgi:hypothetical protein
MPAVLGEETFPLPLPGKYFVDRCSYENAVLTAEGHAPVYE